MFWVSSAIWRFIYLLLKVLVPVILIITIVVLIYIYYKNRGEADEKIAETKEKLNEAKTKVTSFWQKFKLFFNFMKKNDAGNEEEKEMEDV